MIPLTINNFLLYFSIVWGTNISLNLLYVVKRYIPRTAYFDRPIDGGLEYKGDRLIGESTTIAGLILCLIISIIFYFTLDNFVWTIIPVLVYLGHMLGSILKRRMHKKGGEFVPFVDHGDYVILVGVVLVMLQCITWKFAILSILATYVLHPLGCLLAFKLKLREYPF